MPLQLAIASDEISHDFSEAVALGVEWGVRLFELKRCREKRVPDVDGDDIAEVERVLEKAGARLTSLAPGLFKGPPEPEVIAAEQARLVRTIALAERLGVDRIVVFGFARDAAPADEDGRARVVDVLGGAADVARRHGMTLLLENEPAFWADCPDATRAILDAVASPALRANWDPCNALGCACGAPYPSGYDLLRDHVAHVHVKDAVLRADGTVEYAVVGSGDVDWAGQFAALAADNFAGYCVLEPHFGDRISSSRAAIVAARELIAAVEVGAR
jgi:L-ribulose-5-phosphate 3-epimerase